MHTARVEDMVRVGTGIGFGLRVNNMASNMGVWVNTTSILLALSAGRQGQSTLLTALHRPRGGVLTLTNLPGGHF